MNHIVVFLVIIFMLSGCSEEQVPEQKLKPVSAIELKKTNSFDSRILSGVIQPADTTTLTFEVSGKVEDVFFDIGEAFDKGEPLAKLEQTKYLLAVQEAKGQVSNAKATMLNVKQDFERKASLVDDGAVSGAQYDAAKSQYESAKDKVDIAQVRLAMAKEKLKDTTLIAPYAGTISKRNIEPSQQVSPNISALLIQGKESFEVSALAPEGLLSSLTIDKPAKVTISALDKSLNAKIKEIGSAAQGANAFPIILKISANDIAGIRTGMSAEVQFKQQQGESHGFMVPVSAIMAKENNQHFVFKLITTAQADSQQAGYVLQKTTVDVMKFFAQKAQIKGDLKEGEQIVNAGMAFLHDGQKVTLIEGKIKRLNP
ncbi:MFP transporter [Pseudoalteromonas undina]|uniref:efflux RND transporter periplasmic adaptor subunit n=1 Tax=Pseudoalteromonas undina TaxID=43660 RepID=UPI0006BAF11A|nr:efflux RND transporter periplasmic adaptor subunit [Pseudoalteromonas undina]KPH90290.1 MFP transporter [Pseudoalteromonas undina]